MTVLPTKRSKIEKCKAALPYLLVGLIFLTELVIFCFFGENNFIEVHDNLDLFVPHLTMLKETGTFFSQDATLPLLGGVSSDVFGWDWMLYN